MGEEVEKNIINIMREYELSNSRDHEEIRLKHAETQKDVAAMTNTTCRIEVKLDKFIDKADKTYAPIWVARAITWASMVIGGTILVSLIGTIIVK